MPDKDSTIVSRKEVQGLFQQISTLLTAIGDGRVVVTDTPTTDQTAVAQTQDRQESSPTDLQEMIRAAVRDALREGRVMPAAARPARTNPHAAGPRIVYDVITASRPAPKSVSGAAKGIYEYLKAHNRATVADIMAAKQFARSTVMNAMKELRKSNLVKSSLIEK